MIQRCLRPPLPRKAIRVAWRLMRPVSLPSLRPMLLLSQSRPPRRLKSGTTLETTSQILLAKMEERVAQRKKNQERRLSYVQAKLLMEPRSIWYSWPIKRRKTEEMHLGLLQLKNLPHLLANRNYENFRMKCLAFMINQNI